MTKMCKATEETLADLLLSPEQASAEARAHVESCAACRAELETLRATMQLLDAWEAPEPNPFFMTRFEARLREEQARSSMGWLARLRFRLLVGERSAPVRPLAAMCMMALLMLGGGAYLSLSEHESYPMRHPMPMAVVSELQVMDTNAQLLDQLEALSGAQDDAAQEQQ